MSGVKKQKEYGKTNKSNRLSFFEIFRLKVHNTSTSNTTFLSTTF